MKKILFSLLIVLLLCFSVSAQEYDYCAGAGGAAACATEADSETGSTTGNINPIGWATYNDYAAQVFVAAANATICKATLRLYRTQTDSSPAMTGKVCIYDATGYVNNTAWAVGTAYTASIYRRPVSANGYVYKQTVASCTSHADTEPTWTTTVGATYADNDCSWTNMGLNEAPGSLIGTCSDEINLITSSTTSEGDVTFSNLSAAVTASTKYFLVFYTPTIGDAGDYARWAYAAALTPATTLTGGAVNSLVPLADLKKTKFILYK
jgi:hypothetical protein